MKSRDDAAAYQLRLLNAEHKPGIYTTFMCSSVRDLCHFRSILWMHSSIRIYEKLLATFQICCAMRPRKTTVTVVFATCARIRSTLEMFTTVSGS